MERRAFLHKLVRYGIVLFLASIAILLSKKTVFKKDCKTCSQYGSCTNADNCTIPSSK